MEQLDLFSLPPTKEEKDHYNIYRMADHQIIRMIKKACISITANQSGGVVTNYPIPCTWIWVAGLRTK